MMQILAHINKKKSTPKKTKKQNKQNKTNKKHE